MKLLLILSVCLVIWQLLTLKKKRKAFNQQIPKKTFPTLAIVESLFLKPIFIIKEIFFFVVFKCKSHYIGIFMVHTVKRLCYFSLQGFLLRWMGTDTFIE